MNETEITVKNAPSQGLRRIPSFLRQMQTKIATSKSSYLGYCFLVPVVLMFLVYLAMELYPIGNGTVLVLDLNGQYVYFYEALRGFIYGENSLLYSFLRGLGGEFVGIYAYYLASPLSYLVALFPQGAIQEALLCIILLKVGLCGLTFGFYLHKHSSHPNRWIVVAFSAMYALCAYAVVYQSNLMWIDALLWLPMLTYAIEQLILNRRYRLFVISLAMSVMSNYYIGYMVCIYVVLYSCYYYFSKSPEEINPQKERLHLPRAVARVSVFSLLALAISAFIILGAYYSLGFGKNTFSDPDWSLQEKFKFLDLFTKFLPGTYDTVRPEGLPFVYCGLLTLLLLPVYFMSRAIRSREKIASALIIAVFTLSFIASPLDLIWHGFQAPNWLNYRYSFMLSFLLLTMAYRGIGNLKRVGGKFLFCVASLILLFVAVCNKLTFDSYVVTDNALLPLETVWLTILATVVLLALLCLWIRHEHPKYRESISAILVAVVCIEIFCSSLTCVVQFDDDVSYSTHSSYSNFIGDLRPIVNKVKAQDDGFYRMEKLAHRKFNDNMALGIRGFSGSTSTLNSETIDFLRTMGYVSRSHLSQYRGGNPVNDSLLGVKYLIDKNESDLLIHQYDAICSDEKYTAYQNPYALSLAYGVDSSFRDFDPSEHHPIFTRLNQMVGAMTGDPTHSAMFRPITRYEEKLSSTCTSTPEGYQTTYTKSSSAAEASVTFHFTATRSANYYFYPPSPLYAEVALSVGDETRGKYLGRENTYAVMLGYFEEGEPVEVTLTLSEETPSLSLYHSYYYFYYIDEENLKTSFEILKQNPQFIIEEHTDDHLSGHITTEQANQMIFTSIPYDEGWKIYLDGEEIQYDKTMDALISFDIQEAGKHTLEMKYRPSTYRLGMIISLSGLFLFLILCLADWLFFRKRRRKLWSETWLLEDFDRDHERFSALSEEEKPFRLKEIFKALKFKKETPPELKNNDEFDDMKGNE
ncbi:MAG: YfhO family protein [Clostridia bacterium]|nr:YfhO family protein [Clostridia bacterium]